MQTFNVQRQFQGGFTRKRSSTSFIVIHHAAALYRQPTGIEDVTAVVDYHTKTRGWPGIGYAICLAEEVNGGPIARYNVSDPDLERAHVWDRNDEAVGVACLTNFTGLPEQKWIDALVEVVRELKQRYPHAQIVGHKEIARPGHETACPGPRWLEWKPELLRRVVSVPSGAAGRQAEPTPPGVRRFRVRDGAVAIVRQDKTASAPEAGRLAAGTVVEVKALVFDRERADRDWWHLQSDQGFVEASALERAG